MKYSLDVIIPTRGRTAELSSAIESAIRIDSDIKTNIYVVDDNAPNSDAHRESRKVFKEEKRRNNRPWQKLSILSTGGIANGSVARNKGLAASSSSYVIFLDDDDELIPETITTKIRMLDSSEGRTAAIYSPTIEQKRGIARRITTYSESGSFPLDVLALRSEVPTSSLIFRRKALVSIGGFCENYKRHQDFQLLLELFRQGWTITYTEEPGSVKNNDDAANRKNVQAIADAKKKLLDDYAPFYRDNHRARRLVYRAHFFEMAIVYLKQGYIVQAWRCILTWPPGKAELKKIHDKFFAKIKTNFYRKTR